MNKVVCTFGAWDILHVGHINYLKKAKSLGDKLFVGVQDDASIALCKPEGASINEGQRKLVIENLKFVDTAELYQFNYLEIFKNSGANILAMSEDHRGGNRFKELYSYVTEKYGKEALNFIPYDKSMSSSVIKETIKNSSWNSIWNSVAGDESKNDYEICGYSSVEDVKTMSDHIARKANIGFSDRVLDYGCGSGLILKNLNLKDGSIGIDASPDMIERAYRNNPNHMFFVDNRPNIKCNNIDVIICWGVIHYLSNHDQADVVINDMINLSSKVLIMEIPDIDKKEAREDSRRKLGMNPFPPHLYFNRKLFEDLGFKCYDNDIFLTKNSKYSFTVTRGI